MEYTQLRNRNRGYMKLDVWQKAIELYKLLRLVQSLETKKDKGDWNERV